MVPDGLAQLQPVCPRHADVQQDKVGLQAQLRQGLFGVVGLANQISALGQVRVQQVGEHGLVINHENLLGHAVASNLTNHKTGKSKNCQARALHFPAEGLSGNLAKSLGARKANRWREEAPSLRLVPPLDWSRP